MTPQRHQSPIYMGGGDRAGRSPFSSLTVAYWLLASGQEERLQSPVRLYSLRQKPCVFVLQVTRETQLAGSALAAGGTQIPKFALPPPPGAHHPIDSPDLVGAELLVPQRVPDNLRGQNPNEGPPSTLHPPTPLPTLLPTPPQIPLSPSQAVTQHPPT